MKTCCHESADDCTAVDPDLFDFDGVDGSGDPELNWKLVVDE